MKAPMKTLLILICTLITLPALSAPPLVHTGEIDSPIVNESEGTKDGGGGNLKSGRSSKQQILDVIENAKIDLKRNISFSAAQSKNLADEMKKSKNSLYEGYKMTEEDAFLVNNAEKLIARLDKLTVRVLTNEPCRDATGRAVDGSVYGMPENQICISASRVQDKLLGDRLERQLRGLIVHELSHLEKASERIARKLEQPFPAWTYVHKLKQMNMNLTELDHAAELKKLLKPDPKQTGFHSFARGTLEMLSYDLFNGTEVRITPEALFTNGAKAIAIVTALKEKSCADDLGFDGPFSGKGDKAKQRKICADRYQTMVDMGMAEEIKDEAGYEREIAKLSQLLRDIRSDLKQRLGEKIRTQVIGSLSEPKADDDHPDEEEETTGSAK